MTISPIARPELLGSLEKPRSNVTLQIFPDPIPPEQVVRQVSSIQGPVDAYFWYEGSLFLPQAGAAFMQREILGPLQKSKQDAKLWLYSLRAWDCKTNIDDMAMSTPIGEAINRINRTVVEMIYSSSFFRYCADLSVESPLYSFISEKLPQKEWLFQLSESHCCCGIKTEDLFKHTHSAFDSIQKVDLAQAYSHMQYVEAYYLIQESIKSALSQGRSEVNVAFVLPNDEIKYYRDLPEDIETMLALDFGERLADMKLSISFHAFSYGDSIAARPYIDKRRGAPRVSPEEILAYFQPPSKPSQPQEPFAERLFLRDVIHNINGWE